MTLPPAPTTTPRRGAAMPWVLMGMGLAMLVGVLAWTRAWTHRDRASLQSARWSAQLLAESALACAEDEVWERSRGAATTRPDSTPAGAKDTSARALTESVDSCPVPFGGRGTLERTIEDGDLLVPVLATGEIPHGSRTVRRSIRAILGGSLDRALFDAAVSQLRESTPPLDVTGSRIVGRVGTKPVGQIGLASYVPTSRALDTTVLSARMKEAFRAEDAFAGSGRYGKGMRFPERDEIVHTSFGSGGAEVVVEGPNSRDSRWKPPEGRTLIVEGDVSVRGNVDLEGWTILARGRIALERGSRSRHVLLYAERGVVVQDDAVVQGQILTFRTFEMHDETRLLGPSVAICLSGAEAAKVLLDGRSKARVYLVATGGTSSVRIDREALLEGVVVAGGTLRVDGTVHGSALAERFDCGRAETSCTGSGTFDRTALPVDFTVPLGLPGAQGMRVASWEVVE